MKIVLNILCWVFAVFCCCFPFIYNHGNMDKMEIRISHILVDTQEEAADIKEQISNGKSFEEMAEQYSLCASKEQKGDIGYQMKNNGLLKEVEETSFNLKLNEVSEPVKSAEGWHLIKVSDIKYFSDKENFEKRYF